MSERLNYTGHLSMLVKARKTLEIEIAGIVKAMRENLDVLARPEKLKADLIANQALQLRNKQVDLIAIAEDMAKIYEMYPDLKEGV